MQDQDANITTAILSNPQDATVKVLGIHRQPERDILQFKLTLSTSADSTKRQILSDVARIFVPLGLLAPVVIQFKILFQELWLLDLGWDSQLPPKLADLWQKYRTDLIALKQLKIKRYMGYARGAFELHAFSDASIKAYAAVVYSRIIQPDGNTEVTLIAAKTRVAPLKQQSLPRLELCGAVLLSRLIASITTALQHMDIKIYAWCDSSIVFAWLSHPPCKLKTFVGNRTAEILDIIRRSAWHHDNTKENPADCASGGMLASKLTDFELWWKGPPWLYDKDIEILKSSDASRLHNSTLPYGAKLPIILPKSHRITKLILEHEHWTNLHPGVSALFVIVRQRYWILGARNLMRKVTHDCLNCFRQRQNTNEQFMADLPAVRVRQALPFENTGCDYAGPLTLKVHKRRNPRKEKGYVCLFVCLATSAIHLELATDLSTETFLVAFRRFISRRGKCAQIYSDNGRNFVGERRALNEMEQLLTSQLHNSIVTQTLANEGNKWSFIPPHAPHWGGKWESAVRSVKLHLHRVVLKTTLTFEQMHTLLAQIEAVVNSRPLFTAPDTYLTYLSPAHLLFGRPYTMLPEGNILHVPQNRLDIWQQTQSMLQGFWKQWHQEYLTTLQNRHKWNTHMPNLKFNNFVLVKDSNTPLAWMHGFKHESSKRILVPMGWYAQ